MQIDPRALQQLVAAGLAFVTAVISFITARRSTRSRRRVDGAEGAGAGAGAGARSLPAWSVAVRRPSLNGYATVLRETLDRLEWLRSEYDALAQRYTTLESQLADCEHHRQQRQRQRQRQGQGQRSRTSTQPAVETPSAAPKRARKRSA